jgi:nitroimidazol reductase NimA-like FMN-containing flavoprotein (pyridoxamine 5'-phosphate oxidase superfamily)
MADDTADLVAMAREVIDTNRYFVLGTVGPDGAPRVSPVYYGVDGYRDFYWVSSPEAQHSVNIGGRPEINAVAFDSSAQVGDGRAVYLTGQARRVPDEELPERCPVAFRTDLGGRAFTPEELTGAAPLRLYLLSVEVWEVHLPGRDPRNKTGIDHRVPVHLASTG